MVAATVALVLAACGRREATPEVIGQVPAGAHLLGAAAGRVFWSQGPVLHWVGGPGQLAGSLAVTGVDELYRVRTFVDATGVYYLRDQGLERIEVGGDGGASQRSLGAVAAHPGGLARHRDCLYVLDVDVDCKGNGALVGVPLVAGATCKRHGISAEGKPLRPFAANDQRIVWVNGGCEHPSAYYESGIFSLYPDTGYVQAAVRAEPAPNELQVGDRDTYWRVAGGLHAAPAATLFSGVVVDHPVLAFVVDHDTIFYTDDAGLHAVSAPTRGAARLLAAAPGISQLVADTHHLYWLAPTGDLVRLHRP